MVYERSSLEPLNTPAGIGRMAWMAATNAAMTVGLRDPAGTRSFQQLSL